MLQLRTALQSAGLSVWIDDEALEPGTPIWQQSIEDAIQRARCMVVVLSPDAKKSKWVNTEIAVAEREGLRIFPLLAVGNENSALPFALAATQYVDARQDFGQAVSRNLLPALRLYLALPEPVAPTPGNIPRRAPYLWVALVLIALVVGSLGFYFVERFLLPQQPAAPTLVAIESTPALAAEAPTSPPTATPLNTETPDNIASTQAATALAETSVDATLTREATPTPTPTETPIPKPTATSTSEPTATDTPLPRPTVMPTEVPAPVAGATRTNPQDGAEYVYVPAGPFIMGSTEGQITDAFESCQQATNNQCQSIWFEGEAPQSTINADEFWIMRTEVTNAQYGLCVEAKSCTAPNSSSWNDPQFGEHPVTDVTWYQANDYAKWVGGRLPTEAEWEKACRGTDGFIYPWGDSGPTADLANFNSNVGDTTPVGKYSPRVTVRMALLICQATCGSGRAANISLIPTMPPMDARTKRAMPTARCAAARGATSMTLSAAPSGTPSILITGSTMWGFGLCPPAFEVVGLWRRRRSLVSGVALVLCPLWARAWGSAGWRGCLVERSDDE